MVLFSQYINLEKNLALSQPIPIAVADFAEFKITDGYLQVSLLNSFSKVAFSKLR